MVETVLTLVSVAFGALLTYIFQWLTESRQHKRELRKEKVIVFSRFLKEDILNGPNNNSMHAEHFDDVIYMSKIYPLFLDNYYYYPKNIREKLDEIYIQLKNVELNDMPQEVTKKEYYRYIADLYNQSISLIRKELMDLINN